MSIFSQLDNEIEVQLNDQTRLNASKSFASKAVQEITTLTIKPTDDGSAIDCFSSSENDRYLDWVYTSFAIDVNSDNDDLIFNEGGSDISTNLSTGTYTLAQYATEVASKMTTAGGTYSASVSGSVITLTGAASFELKDSSVQRQLHIAKNVSKLSHESSFVECGVRNITVAVSNGTESDSKSFQIKVYSKEGDYLFCEDGHLKAHEPDIMKWLPEGRSSYKDVIRRAQGLIVAWLDEKGYVNVYGNKYTKRDIIDVEEVKQWSIFMTLRLIFQGISNSVDDVFDLKAKNYAMNEEAARQRVVLRLDSDEDGVADEGETLGISSGSLYRR